MKINYPAYDDDKLEKLRYGLLDEGYYDFEVIKCVYGISKPGNEMITLDLKVLDEEGSVHIIKSWLIITDKMLFMLKHFWSSVGRPDMFGKQDTEEREFLGRCGRLEIKHQASQKYGRTASVVDFLPCEHPQILDMNDPDAFDKIKVSDAPEFDDDISY